MSVDDLVICNQDLLPFCLPLVMDGIGSLPCHQRCISLPSSQLRFIARGVWCLGVSAHVQDGDSCQILFSELLQEILGALLCGCVQISQTQANWTMTLTWVVVCLAGALQHGGQGAWLIPVSWLCGIWVPSLVPPVPIVPPVGSHLCVGGV